LRTSIRKANIHAHGIIAFGDRKMKRNIESPPAEQTSPGLPQTSLAQVPAFTPVLAAAMTFLLRLPAPRHVAVGTALVEQGSFAHSVHLVERGVVKLVHLSACGRETTTGLRSVGWYAGSASAILKAPSIYTVQAVTDCMVVRIPASEFLHRLRDSSEMMDHFLAGLCFEVASQASLQAQLMGRTAEERLNRFTHERAAVNPQRPTLDPLPVLKQMELAQLLSITPEHLSRLMHKRKEVGPLESALPALGGRRDMTTP